MACFIETVKLVELIFGSEAAPRLSCIMFEGNSSISKNKDTSVWNFVPDFELSQFFCFFSTACRYHSSTILST